ncbi:CLUMA_CG000952, isoform A [Clunio marinus]|uniref:CLUMA_CG000952, isoform A n=1 Tax=Clunio marinus TaxID=568069 RepID=A0A1J1HGK9_9DIPT|nr:CLUMA_CG000952, isoform A [Clunio marinus]
MATAFRSGATLKNKRKLRREAGNVYEPLDLNFNKLNFRGNMFEHQNCLNEFDIFRFVISYGFGLPFRKSLIDFHQKF